MKILICRKDLRDTASGAPQTVLHQVAFYHKKGHTVYTMSETVNREMVEKCGGIPIKSFRWPISGFFRRKFYQFQVNLWIKKNKPDLVVGHGDILNQDVLYIHNCVHLAHELIEKRPLPADHEVGKIHSEIFEKGSFKLFITNSDLMKNDLVKRFNLDPSNVMTIYPEINVQKFFVPNPEAFKKEMRAEFGFKDDEFVVSLITSGNFKKRNLGLLIDAFNEIAAEFPKAKLFIGGGKIDQVFYDQVAKSPFKDRVTFAPQVIDVKRYFYLVDVFVLPAFIEEYGRTVLDAMICGQPVITTSTVGAGEILENESREMIMPEVKKEELVLRLRKLLSSPELCKKIGQLNKATALKYQTEDQDLALENALKKFKLLS
ncbi:MAG: glycosyltransferase family 4 protein [Bacteriovoracaceae bacterium]